MGQNSCLRVPASPGEVTPSEPWPRRSIRPESEVRCGRWMRVVWKALSRHGNQKFTWWSACQHPEHRRSSQNIRNIAAASFDGFSPPWSKNLHVTCLKTRWANSITAIQRLTGTIGTTLADLARSGLEPSQARHSRVSNEEHQNISIYIYIR